MANKSNEPNISFSTLEYWDKTRDILAAAGRYAHSTKLKANFYDEATHFKVQHVINKYYGGNINNLTNEIHYRRREVFHAIAIVSELCRRYGIRETRDKEALTEFLLDENRRKGWKKLIKKHEKLDEIVPLQTIELEYRKTLNKGS